jgi:nucleolar protein 16
MQQEKAEREAKQTNTVWDEKIEPEINVDKRSTRIGKKINLKIDPQFDELLVKTAPIHTEVIAELEKQAASFVPVQQRRSTQEAIIFDELVAKYGQDYQKMAADVKLNKYQLSAGQLKRKILNRK